MQALHILKKDLRNNRNLILFALLPVFAEIWIAPYQWGIPLVGNGWNAADILRSVGLLLLVIIVICWMILIARVVHAESLIGDRQLWLTRPYNRISLLGAKLLFVLLTISLPFLMLHAILLAEAGFSPWRWLPQLLLNGAALFVGPLLILIAIATITSTLQRSIFVFLGLLLLLLLSIPIALVTGIGIDPMPLHLGAFVNSVNQIAAILFCCVPIFVQYRYRKTALAASLLVAGIVISVMLPIANLQRFAVDRNYLPISATDAAGYKFEYDASRALSYYTSPPNSPFDLRVFMIPMHFKNRAPEYGMHLDGIRYTLESADGRRWQSNWKKSWGEPLIDENATNLLLQIPAWVYNRFAAHPIKVRIELAISEVKADAPRGYTLSKPFEEFSVPEVGYCVSEPNFGSQGHAVICRTPYNRAPLMLARSALFSSQRCSEADRRPDSEGMSWIGSLSPSESTFQMLPVEYPSFPIPHSAVPYPILCPGTPVTFTPYHLVRQIQTAIVIDSYDLQYRPGLPPKVLPEPPKVQGIDEGLTGKKVARTKVKSGIRPGCHS